VDISILKEHITCTVKYFEEEKQISKIIQQKISAMTQGSYFTSEMKK